MCEVGRRRDTMKFLVQKFEKFGWTSKEGSKPALAKLIKIADYPVSPRPRLAEDDNAFFEEDEDGNLSMKQVMLPGDAEEGGRRGGGSSSDGAGGDDDDDNDGQQEDA